MSKPGVYILQSKKNGRYYIGSTEDVQERFVQHASGLVKATRYLRPLELKVFVECVSSLAARQAELRLKNYKSRVIVEKVIEDSILPWKYSKNTGG